MSQKLKDLDRLSNGLAKLSEEDPTFTVKTDDDTGQTVISGMGELHLEIIIDRYKRELEQRQIKVVLRLLIKLCKICRAS